MEVLDIILLAIFIPAIVFGLAKGIIIQVVSLVSVIVGAILAGRFAPELCEVAVRQFDSDPKVSWIICFILIFLVCGLVMALIGKLITKLFKIATLGWLNRLLGAVFAIVTTALVLGLLISAFEGLNASWGLVNGEYFGKLKVYPVLRDFASGIFPQIKVFVNQLASPGQCVNV